jgi:Undecaprenyl-phosphate glucose phosphotransferase
MFRIDPKQAVIEHVASGSDRTGGLSPVARSIAEAPVAETLSGPVIEGAAQLVEAGLLLLVGTVIYVVMIGFAPAFYLPALVATVIVANVGFNILRTHRISAYRRLAPQLLRVVPAWLIACAALAAIIVALRGTEHHALNWLGAWTLVGLATLVAFRIALNQLVLRWTRQGRLKRRTVIVGGGEPAGELIARIRAQAEDDIELLGLFDDRVDQRSPDMVAGCPKLGRVTDLVEFARRTPVDLVIVSMPLSAEKRVLEMLRTLWVLPVDIRLSAHMSQLKFTNTAYSYVGGLPVFDMADRPISDWNVVFKWVFDKAVAVGALVLLSPVMLLTAIAIKLESKGPVLFRQDRHGFNNKTVRIYKFRSMYTDRSDADAAKLVTKGDPRVTRVGRFIRKTSIDEIPQLFNVLKGELSIVGPRPHAMQAKAANALYYEAVEGYFARHRVKPGITGWAQINGWRGETDTIEKLEQRFNHDLYYIEHWSILFDLYILAMTPVSLLSKTENAY